MYYLHLRQIAQWFKKDFILLLFLNLAGAAFIYFTHANELVKMVILIPLLLKVFHFMKATSIMPSLGADNQNFSWKYLQSLPLSKPQLLNFLILSFMLNIVPAVIWFICFQNIILMEFFEVKNINFTTLLVYYFTLIPVAALAGVSLIHAIIQFPRNLYNLKNRNIIFCQTIRNLMIGMVILIYGYYAFSSFNIPLMLLTALKIIVSLSHEWMTPFAAALFFWFCYHRTLKTWLNEKLSYKKINWSFKRDSLLILTSFSLLFISFEFKEISIPSEYSGSKISQAVYKKDRLAIEALLIKGEDINNPGKYGFSPIMTAAHEGNYDMFLYLEGKGAKLEGSLKKESESIHNGMSLLLTAIEGKNIQIVKHLLSKGDSPTAWNNKENYSALHLAAAMCRVEIMDELISKGANLKSLNKSGGTALHEAIKRNCFPAAASLIEAGINTEIKDLKGRLAFEYILKTNEQQAYYLKKKARAPANAN